MPHNNSAELVCYVVCTADSTRAYCVGVYCALTRNSHLLINKSNSTAVLLTTNSDHDSIRHTDAQTTLTAVIDRPIECMSPLSMLALSRLDMARTVQLRSALRLLVGHLRTCPSAFSSVASSEQSFSRFMNRVKYLQTETTATLPTVPSRQYKNCITRMIVKQI